MDCIKKLIDMLKEEDISKSHEKITESIEGVLNALDDVKEDINDIIFDGMDSGDYVKIKRVAEIAEQIKVCKEYVLTSLLKDEPIEINPPVPRVYERKEPEKHPLEHDCSFTKPYSFEIGYNRYDIPKNTWVNFFYRLCDILYARDKNIFENYIRAVERENLSYCKFSKLQENDKSAHRIENTEIYVKFMGSANAIRDYARELLRLYKLEDKTVVYWLKQKDDTEEESRGLTVGSKVRHIKFGDGVVTKIQKRTPIGYDVNVRFSSGEEKPFMFSEKLESDFFVKMEE